MPASTEAQPRTRRELTRCSPSAALVMAVKANVLAFASGCTFDISAKCRAAMNTTEPS